MYLTRRALQNACINGASIYEVQRRRSQSLSSGQSAWPVSQGAGTAGAFAAFEVGKQPVGWPVLGRRRRERRSGSPGRSVFLLIHRVENPRCRSRSSVPSPESPSFSPVDESLGLNFLTGPGGLQPSPALLHAWGQGRRLGGMNPSCLKRLLTRAGRRWMEEAAARGGNGAGGSCAVSRGSVPLRRGRGSVPGVQRDGQFP